MTKTKNDEYFRKVLTENDAVLAPLAGVTDAAFREICTLCGADMMYTEMVSAKGMVYSDKATKELLALSPLEKNTGVQIFGSEEHFLSEAVKRYLNDSPFMFIDINMGCPVKKIVSNKEGSALLADTKKLYSVAKSVVDASDKPVSAKIRLGVGNAELNYMENAKALEDAGIAMVALHARTREQMYSGKADWDSIARLKQNVSIPVIGNGDVFSSKDYLAMKEHTGCDGVMIARGALGNPFIFEDINATKQGLSYEYPSLSEKLAFSLKHFDVILKYKCERIACLEFRKLLCWYTKGTTGGAAVRRDVNRLSSPEVIREYVMRLIEENKPQ